MRMPLEFLAVAIVAAGLGYLAAISMHAFDQDLSMRLLSAFGASDFGTVHDAITPTLLGLALVGFAEAAIIRALPGPPRFIASGILLVLAIAYQNLVFKTMASLTYPVGYIAAFATGIAGGMYLRNADGKRRKEESTYYEIKLKDRELQEARLELLKQDEIERRILAADLHDQVLNDLKQVVHRFEKYVKEPDDENADKIKVLTAQVMREIREVMDSLSPSVLEHLGLGPAIEDCLRRGAERASFRTRFKNRVEGDALDSLTMVEKGLLYRLVQESITNICKHANASTVRATMETEDDDLVIRVIDDGKGLDPAVIRGDSRGMKYMRYRADLIGATIAWKPGENGKGTSVEIRMKYNHQKV